MTTLHFEIRSILKDAGTALTTNNIAKLVNIRGNYRKRDGSAVTAFQIYGRTKNYPNLFKREGTMVRLNDDNKTEKSNEPKNEIKIDQGGNDVTKIKYLTDTGFINIGKVGDILVNGLPIIKELLDSGLYAVTKPDNYTLDFLSEDEVMKNGNVINPWEVKRLKNKWVDDVDVVYYGIAGKKSFRSLKKRLNDLIKHGNGKTSDRGPHKGGEIFWQLKGYKNFELWVLARENPREFEKELLRIFHKQTRKKPFANRQF